MDLSAPTPTAINSFYRSALLALKTGGTLVYSTCALSNLENDLLIEKLIEKKGSTFEVDDSLNAPCPPGEKTKFGLIFLPDRSGIGPSYCTRLKKI